MKIKILIFFSLLVIATATLAQNTPTGFGSLNIGGAYPIGDYSKGGYALTGYDIYYAAGFPIKHSNYGISTKVDFFGNAFDNNKYLTDYSLTYVNGKSYNGETILVGAFATIPVNRTSFDFRLMGGIMAATLPELSVNTGYLYTSFDNATAVGFAYDAGMGMRTEVSKRICLMFDFDYLSSTPKFNWPTHQSGNTFTTPVSQQFSFISWTGGIGWYF